MEISERGYWIGDDMSIHQFDRTFAERILYIIGYHEYREIIDIGCGDGSYTKFLNNNGLKCYGFDGNPDTYNATGECKVLDFSQPVDIKPSEVVLCLEVGEHVPKKYQDILIKNITDLAKHMIILSWGIPDQGGFGHVNCRTNNYIVRKVIKHGFKYHSGESFGLRTYSTKTWFKNTLMVFHRDNNKT